mgnify:CR=1 FL=1|jgi:hypothetical protein
MGVKIDLDNFEYNSKYNLPNEHCWDFMKDSEKEKEYFDKKAELSKPKRSIVASNPEVVGQIGSMISADEISSINFETNRVD